ncbi:MAG: translation initiation factor IF-3, partial [Pseudoalteromonas tetraodonis]
MVIDDEGENLGVLDTQDAIDRAQAKTLDLVEVSPMADPPVCRFMDYGKYAFERQKQVQAQRKNARKTQIKEIKFRPGTDIGDYNTKI